MSREALYLRTAEATVVFLLEVGVGVLVLVASLSL